MKRQNWLYVERILGLPIGSIKKDKHKPEMKALLKIIKKMPWLLDMASYGYDPIAAKNILMKVSADIMFPIRSKK
jgi:hypothetical protein